MSFVIVLILILGVGVAALSIFIVRMVSAPRQSKALAEALKQGHSSVVVRSAKALLDWNPRPTETEIRTAISGNLCRCTGYQQIVEAITQAAK